MKNIQKIQTITIYYLKNCTVIKINLNILNNIQTLANISVAFKTKF